MKYSKTYIIHTSIIRGSWDQNLVRPSTQYLGVLLLHFGLKYCTADNTITNRGLTVVWYVHIYEVYGLFNWWKPFVFDISPLKDNSLFRDHIQNMSLLRHPRH